MILPAVYQCKVYCNNNFSGVHVRSAVVVAAGTPKRKQRIRFPEPLMCRAFAQTNRETKLREGHTKCAAERKKNTTERFRKTQ